MFDEQQEIADPAASTILHELALQIERVTVRNETEAPHL